MTDIIKLTTRATSQDKSESQIQSEIRKHLGSLPDVLLFRNNTGKLPDRTGRMVVFGLCVGSSDLIGIVRRADGVGVFLALEVKDASGRASAEQIMFIDLVRRYGGVSGVVRSVEDAMVFLEEARG
jgi:hypothetical protein